MNAAFVQCADCASPVGRRWVRRCKTCGATLGPVCSEVHQCPPKENAAP